MYSKTEYLRKWRENNPDKIREINKRSYIKRRDKIRNQKRDYYQKNRERICDLAKEYRKRNTRKLSEYFRKYRKRNAEQIRERQLKKNYGITAADYYSLLESQGGVCAVCKTDKSGNGNKHFYVDHCHDTGDVRGILCHKCNLALGHASDDIRTLRLLIEYLERHERKIRVHIQ